MRVLKDEDDWQVLLYGTHTGSTEMHEPREQDPVLRQRITRTSRNELQHCCYLVTRILRTPKWIAALLLPKANLTPSQMSWVVLVLISRRVVVQNLPCNLCVYTKLRKSSTLSNYTSPVNVHSKYKGNSQSGFWQHDCAVAYDVVQTDTQRAKKLSSISIGIGYGQGTVLLAVWSRSLRTSLRSIIHDI